MGDPITANDFLETWKTLLTPDFAAPPNAYQLYVIEGAKAAKEGKAPLGEIGLSAPSPTTLVVELESPTPYFLELTAAHFYYPVHHSLRQKESSVQSQVPIVNGPFILKNWAHQNELALEKNPRYWDSLNVHLDGILVMILDENTALQMFETGKLDWTRSPLNTLPADSIDTLKKKGKLKIAQAAGTHWIRINTEMGPFTNHKIRKAFSVAIDRKAIVEHILQGNQTPAMGIVPPSLRLQNSPYFEDHDIPKAWYLFQEALKELNISKDEMPSITLCYSNNDRNHKISQALQQQWFKALNLNLAGKLRQPSVF